MLGARRRGLLLHVNAVCRACTASERPAAPSVHLAECPPSTPQACARVEDAGAVRGHRGYEKELAGAGVTEEDQRGLEDGLGEA
jgi:hypothetical protein